MPIADLVVWIVMGLVFGALVKRFTRFRVGLPPLLIVAVIGAVIGGIYGILASPNSSAPFASAAIASLFLVLTFALLADAARNADGSASKRSFMAPLFVLIIVGVAALAFWSALQSQIAPPDAEGPPTVGGVFVQRDFCPGEGCNKTGRWVATAEVPVYARPDDGAPTIASVSTGEWVDVQGSEVHVVPLRGLALSSGEVAYRLAYAGEGYWSVWRNGQIEVVSGDNFDFGNAGGGIDTGTWWVQIARSDGTHGWVRDTNSFGCTSRYSEHPGCWTDPDRHSQRAEEQTFQNAISFNTLEAYQAFLLEYVDSVHAPTVRDRMAELRARPAAECDPAASGCPSSLPMP